MKAGGQSSPSPSHLPAARPLQARFGYPYALKKWVLSVPFYRTTTMQRHAIAMVGPVAWNGFPLKWLFPRHIV